MILHIGVEFGFDALQIRNQRPIMTPGELLVVRCKGAHHAVRSRARLRLHDLDAFTSIGIRAFFMRADEGNPPAIRRPDRQVLIELRIRSQRFEVFAVDLEQVQVSLAP